MARRDKSEEIKRIIGIRVKIMALNHIKYIQDYAKELGYTKQAYYKIEHSGSNPDFLSILYKRFGVPSDSILFGAKCHLD